MNCSECNNNNKLLISKIIVLIADYVAIVLGTLAAYYLRVNLQILPVSEHFKVDEIYVYGIVPIVFLSILLLNNAYSIVAPYWDTMKNLFRSITIGVVVSIVLMYTGHVINDVSRLFVAFAYLFILFFIFSGRFIVGKILSKVGYLTIPVLLVGAGKTAELVKKSLDRMPIATYKIIGYVDDKPKSSTIANQYPCLGAFKDVETVIKDGKKINKVTNMFPGYVLVEMVMTDEAWYVVRNTSGVSGFIGSSGGGAKPFPLQKHELDPILKNMGISTSAIEIDYAVGDEVNVISGPFAGKSGTVESIDFEKEIQFSDTESSAQILIDGALSVLDVSSTGTVKVKMGDQITAPEIPDRESNNAIMEHDDYIDTVPRIPLIQLKDENKDVVNGYAGGIELLVNGQSALSPSEGGSLSNSVKTVSILQGSPETEVAKGLYGFQLSTLDSAKESNGLYLTYGLNEVQLLGKDDNALTLVPSESTVSGAKDLRAKVTGDGDLRIDAPNGYISLSNPNNDYTGKTFAGVR